MRNRPALVISLLCACIIAAVLCLVKTEKASAAGEKWVKAMDFCSDGMVKDVKEEVTAARSDFDQYCKKAGKSKAVDARCNNGKLEVKCK